MKLHLMNRCRRVAAFAAAALLVCSAAARAQAPEAYHLSGAFAGTHDPSIGQDGKTFYVFATGKAPDGGQFPIRCSEDLHTWRMCGHVFDDIPQWVKEKSPGTKELWAPDISFSHGMYRLYYAYSLFGVNTSGIGLALNKTLDPASPNYKWMDQGLILESKESDDFNAIDPNYIEDAKHHGWLSFGSFWTGIKMRAIDAATGKLSTTDTKLYALASRAKPENPEPQKFDPEHPKLPANWQAIEAPFIVTHGGYYYLFTSWDLCCRGLRSTYKTMVGRAKAVTGPYLDQSGKPLQQGGGTLLLGANARWLGPGGESALHLKDGSDILVFHAYDAKTGRPSLQISPIAWQNGWPVVALGSD